MAVTECIAVPVCIAHAFILDVFILSVVFDVCKQDLSDVDC
jgi:hypothetical protein